VPIKGNRLNEQRPDDRPVEHLIDRDRASRTGVAEAIFASGKSAEQLADILSEIEDRRDSALITRLDPEKAEALSKLGLRLHYDRVSSTARIGSGGPALSKSLDVAVVAAGTSDMPVAWEALRSLEFFGHGSKLFADVGVAGLWRLLDNIDEIRSYRLIIAVAGMEGALFSVLAGLVHAPVIAVPTSVGYGVSAGGHAALTSALASCAPGIVTVNIDNGFGAAAAARKMLLIGRRQADVKNDRDLAVAPQAERRGSSV
jgi:pyridinium-3,5-biscarboxylic acid mononucleotide synthase